MLPKPAPKGLSDAAVLFLANLSLPVHRQRATRATGQAKLIGLLEERGFLERVGPISPPKGTINGHMYCRITEAGREAVRGNFSAMTYVRLWEAYRR